MQIESLVNAKIKLLLTAKGPGKTKADKAFETRLFKHLPLIHRLFGEIYSAHPAVEDQFFQLIESLIQGHQSREKGLQKRDEEKSKKDFWFLSNELAGMSLYVDRFCGDLNAMPDKLPYLEDLGVNFLHIMPIFESPAGESDGGYAVSDFRKVDARFGTLEDLISLRKKMHDQGMYLMLDIVLNHTSHHHEWAKKAKAGDKNYQDFFYTCDNRWIPNEFDATMPDIFPESAPGNFTWNEEMGKWVMTVFHSYQWDLNYMNPVVFREMMENILFYGNLGVDLLRIDAPAFIWKKTGTASQNLPEAHTLLRLIKQCVQVATPGMALLGEAIVAPKEILKYFGTDDFLAQECDFAYNATQMALQWDMLATGETKIMLNAQPEILQKPYGTSWITYTRCHDDIGLGYDDYMIAQAGKDPYQHRKFLKEYYSYSGEQWMSPARGALFSSNPKTGDARISGTLASLCGLEKATIEQNEKSIAQSIRKILMMQAHSIFLGGLPMLFYGDEIGYTNDYSFQTDPGKSYDNRWMHRPVIDWGKVKKIEIEGSIENRIFSGTKKLLEIRKQKSLFSDSSNVSWLSPHNIQVAGFIRRLDNERVYCLFNFSDQAANLTWYAFREQGEEAEKLTDLWSGAEFELGPGHEHLILEPYVFMILQPK
jgi:amylosucrase